MAQLVAHLHGMERVRGSNPLSSTKGRLPKVRKPFFVFQTETNSWSAVTDGLSCATISENLPQYATPIVDNCG